MALLAFVLVFAPVSHSIAMPVGHKMTVTVVTEVVVEDAAKRHHQAVKADANEQSSCDKSSGPSNAKKNCCKVGCLSVATINGDVDLYVTIPLAMQHAVTVQQLFSSSLFALKRPPRA